MRSYIYSLLFSIIVISLSACDKETAGPVDGVFQFDETVTVDGQERSYVLYLPSNYYENDDTDFPLLIAMHGGAGSAEQFEVSTGLSIKADASRFILAYPQGIERPGVLNIQAWNAGACCGYAVEKNQDDVAFIRSLIDELVTEYKINSRRVYATGHSNGGMMSYRLACELSDKVAAIAPNGATMVTTNCTPSRSMPIQHFHSILDTSIPYLGGVGSGSGTSGIDLQSIDSVLNSWAINNNCMNSAEVLEDNEGYTHTRWDNCDNDTILDYYLTKDGGHSWPGGSADRPGADAPSTKINANDLMWEFFQRYELPEG